MIDSVLFKNVFIGGSIADDHGLTKLRLNFEIIRGGKASSGFRSITIPINNNLDQQEFVYRWSIDSLKLQPSDQLNYNIQVWDNDGVNGSKSTKSANYVFHIPTKAEIKSDISNSESETESEINEGLQKAKTLQEAIEEAQKKLKGKQSLDWQDKAMLEDIIRQKQDVDKMLNEMAKENELLEQKRDAFTERDERIKEKADQIKKLMDELLDEETKKLFKELEKLLEENKNIDQVKKLMNKIQQSEADLEKELDGIKELFKQLKFENKLDQAIQEIDKTIEKQKDLLKETEELAEDKKSKNNTDSLNNLADKQEEVKEQAEQSKETLEELNELNEQMEDPENIPDDQQMDEAAQEMEQSKQNMKEGQPKKSQENQKKAIQKMKEMKEQMEGMQNSMEMEMDEDNMESLRQILHGLIKLSFDQEKNMQEFNEVQQTDPKYLGLSQNQLKLKDDSKVLEDSLLALSKKDPFMGSIVIKEIGNLNDHMDKSIDHIRERRKPNASAEMQLSMTGINNLALMINDHFEMMMQMMANAKANGKGKKKGNMKLSELQQQLNQQIEQIKNSGKSGRELSEELARMAAEQERIRKALQELQEKMMNENGNKPGSDIPAQMEQTEMDLVNKQITEQTIRRQRAILTRLLESEKSMREQDLDEERKGETAKDYTNEMPKEFLEYLKLKEKEVELLKTVPLKLYPYYKKEAGEYFKRIGNE
jgi:methyl-accepting chemotaxis protein